MVLYLSECQAGYSKDGCVADGFLRLGELLLRKLIGGCLVIEKRHLDVFKGSSNPCPLASRNDEAAMKQARVQKCPLYAF